MTGSSPKPSGLQAPGLCANTVDDERSRADRFGAQDTRRLEPGECMRTTFALLSSLCAACATASSTSTPNATAAASAISAATGPAATALIEPRSGSTLSGTARFTDVRDGLGVHVEMQGAAPGLHGVH